MIIRDLDDANSPQQIIFKKSAKDKILFALNF